MAGYISDSGSDPYGYDLTLSDEERLITLVDRLSTPARAPAPAPAPAPSLAPATAATRASAPTPRIPPPSTVPAARPRPGRTTSFGSDGSSLDSETKAAIAVHEALDGIDENDLDFDITELGSGPEYSHGSASPIGISPPRPQPPAIQRWLAPSVSSENRSLASFVHKTKPRSAPSMLSDADVRYPDLSRALSDAKKSSETRTTDSDGGDDRPPLLRWRTFPKKPLTVTDLISGSWCELQHFYTLSRRGGKKRRTVAMKAGSEIHEKLEREVYEKVDVQIAKKEDSFGLRVWNIIQGLQILRDTGLTRELEVWGMVDGNLVNGVIDALTYKNPDPELEEDVISRTGSQSSQSSQHQLSLGNKVIFITDVKTRTTKSPPAQPQMRGTIIQLHLYHRFLSQMASGKVDYLQVFERYGMNPDETFSDEFMTQMAGYHDEISPDSDSESSASDETEATEATADFVTAVSTPSQLGNSLSDIIYMKYRTLRSLIPLLKWEIQMTFPRGAATLGQIVSVEYRYRPRAGADAGSDFPVYCNSFFVTPQLLDEYLNEYLQWWRGEREAQGVTPEEAFKCRTCEFVEDCEWRMNLEQEMLRKARQKTTARAAAASKGGRRKQDRSTEW